jgi:hypothetical protein
MRNLVRLCAPNDSTERQCLLLLLRKPTPTEQLSTESQRYS